MKTTLTIKGTHCNSCKALIEDVCKEILGKTWNKITEGFDGETILHIAFNRNSSNVVYALRMCKRSPYSTAIT